MNINSKITITITITITINISISNMGPLERLIGSFYLSRYKGEEEEGEGRKFFLFLKSFLFRFSSQNLPGASQEPPKNLPRALLFFVSCPTRRTSERVFEPKIISWHRGFFWTRNKHLRSRKSVPGIGDSRQHRIDNSNPRGQGRVFS